jgi:hypothetical protein
VELAEVSEADSIASYSIWGPDPNETSDPSVSLDDHGNYFVTFTEVPPGGSGEIWAETGQLPPPPIWATIQRNYQPWMYL